LLRKINTLFPGSCQQGRRKREYKIKPVTLKEVMYSKGERTIVAEVAGEQKVPTRDLNAPANSDNPIP
jgi:hypothetical protein